MTLYVARFKHLSDQLLRSHFEQMEETTYGNRFCFILCKLSMFFSPFLTFYFVSWIYFLFFFIYHDIINVIPRNITSVVNVFEPILELHFSCLDGISWFLNKTSLMLYIAFFIVVYLSKPFLISDEIEQKQYS